MNTFRDEEISFIGKFVDYVLCKNFMKDRIIFLKQ